MRLTVLTEFHIAPVTFPRQQRKGLWDSSHWRWWWDQYNNQWHSFRRNIHNLLASRWNGHLCFVLKPYSLEIRQCAGTHMLQTHFLLLVSGAVIILIGLWQSSTIPCTNRKLPKGIYYTVLASHKTINLCYIEPNHNMVQSPFNFFMMLLTPTAFVIVSFPSTQLLHG